MTQSLPTTAYLDPVRPVDCTQPPASDEPTAVRHSVLDDRGRLALKFNPTLVDRHLPSVAQAIAASFLS